MPLSRRALLPHFSSADSVRSSRLCWLAVLTISGLELDLRGLVEDQDLADRTLLFFLFGMVRIELIFCSI